MDFLSQSLTALTAFSGLFAGAALAFIAPEELRAGKRYFMWMELAILLLLAIFLLNQYSIPLFLRAIIYALLIASLLIKGINNRLVYPVLAAVFFLSAASEALLFRHASLIFLYGLPAGTLFTNVKDSKLATAKNLLTSYGTFVIIAVLLLAIF